MLHQMKLWASAFAAIRSGKKDVEMRLHDEKRQAVQIGDIIEFCNAETGETMRAEVVGKAVFHDFAELYACYDKIRIGYLADETPDSGDMAQYYSDADIAKYGTAAIELKLLRE